MVNTKLQDLNREYEKELKKYPYDVFIPLIALLWGFAYVKISWFPFSLVAFIAGGLLLNIAQKNYAEAQKIKREIQAISALLEDRKEDSR